MTATPAVTSGSRRAVRLVLGAGVATAAVLVLLGLLTAALAADPSRGGAALGLGLAAAGAAVLAGGLLAVARGGALARQRAGRARAVTVLTRCLLVATVVAVALVVAGVVAVSSSRSAAPGVGAAVGAVLLVGLATLAGRSRRRLPEPAVAAPVVIPAQRSAEPAPVLGGASEPGPAAEAR